MWTTADTLMPAWGFYPLAQAYGGTKPLGKSAAWTVGGVNGKLTWIAKFQKSGTYHVWARMYGGYGATSVLIDEQSIAGGRGGPGGGRYVWRHVGAQKISQGSHHIDILVSRGMFDAVLFTQDADFDPTKDDLPTPEKKPLLRKLRKYRDDSHLKTRAGQQGFVLGSVQVYDEVLYDWMPSKTEVIDRLRLWGAPNQHVNGTLALRALETADELRVTLSELVGPTGQKISADRIDFRVVHVRDRINHLFRSSQGKMLVPELLLRDDRTSLPPKRKQGGYGGGECVTRIPAHSSRQFWLTVHVIPDIPSGLYRGEIVFQVEGAKQRTLKLPVELEVLPIDLHPPLGYYGIYNPSQPVDAKRPHHVTPERYLEELKDQVRHGLNATTLYGGFSTLPLAQEAGMTKPPCLMHWPDGSAQQQIAEAKRRGFADLFYYGVDEPNKQEQIERCRKEAERRLGLGLHMFTAINSRTAQMATRDFIDRPVYNIYVFGGKDNAEVMYARNKGFRPISYWTTATAYPLWYRSLTGLYNTACGYLGSSPWSYQDHADSRLYDAGRTLHRVSYPDEFGQPIPTLAWEAHRAGIDDVRYLEALDRAIAAAETRLKQPRPPAGLKAGLEHARSVRRKHFESIDGRWFAYLCRVRPGDLEQARRHFANAIVGINRAVGVGKP
jgi:hypothetical protein